MANNVVTLEKKNQKKNKEAYVGDFIIRNRIPILSIAGVLLLVAIVVCVIFGVTDSVNKKELTAIDSIEYTLTANASTLSESDIASKRETALVELKQYTDKKNIVGVRASMLAADIYFAKKDYTNSLANWLFAAEAQAKAYTAPICYFNAASCSEELGNTSDAVKYYELSATASDFYLAPRAMFNLGRVREASGDFAMAAEAYKKVVDTYSSDEWANLAQSRLIQLKIDGKIE